MLAAFLEAKQRMVWISIFNEMSTKWGLKVCTNEEEEKVRSF